MYLLLPTLGLVVTYQCNAMCKHCGSNCGPRETDWMTEREIKELIRQAATLGARNIVFTGGEPTLLGDRLPELFQFIRDETLIPFCRLVTNGWWASSYDRAHSMLREWKDAGLVELNISCGEFHQEFVPIERIAHAFRAGIDLGFRTVILAGEFLRPGRGTRRPADYEGAVNGTLMPVQYLSPYCERSHGMQAGTVMPWGRGKEYVEDSDLVWSTENGSNPVCADVLASITALPDGRMTACCGVMTREASFLDIGNWREESLLAMTQRAHEDLIFNWIRYVGLRDMRDWLAAKDPSLELPTRCVSPCDLCARMLTNSAAREVLCRYGAERMDDILANRVALESTLFQLEDYVYAPTPASHS